MKTYKVNEIFYSLQGEGVRAGTANVFVRFSGCNLKCSIAGDGGFDCDTEFVSGVKYTAAQLVSEIRKASMNQCPCVILTGGEPSLQVDDELIAALKAADLYIAIETNGTNELPRGIDWVCVSPKSAEHTIKQIVANEVKYVRNAGQGIPRPQCAAEYHLISPAFDAGGGVSSETMLHCIKLVRDNPAWRLSMQLHKLWRVR